jgi:hypothetical protein
MRTGCRGLRRTSALVFLGALAIGLLPARGEDGGLTAVSARERARRLVARQYPHIAEALWPGEHLIFSVRYGPIRAGEATMSVREALTADGDSCFHVVTTAASNDFFSTFFHVRDRVESYMDRHMLVPLRSEKHLREGSYTVDEVVTLDHRNRLASYADGRVAQIPAEAHDILSAFYAMRARDLAPGDSFDLESHVDGKNYPIRVTVHRREHVRVPAGEFDCLVIEPTLRSPGLFKHQGRLLVWVTDDDRKVPVQMKSDLPIGAVSVVLTDHFGRPEWGG